MSSILVWSSFRDMDGGRLSRIRIKKSSEPGFPVFRQAVPAIDRAAFRWLERYFAFFPAVCAGCFRHFAGSVKIPGPPVAPIVI